MSSHWRTWTERAIIGLGLLSFWPWILGYRGAWYMGALALVLIALSVVAVVRFRRVKHAFERHDRPKE